MSIPKELITDIENREELAAFSDVLSKPDWKKFDMRLAKAQSDYLKGAHLNSRDALKKYMQEILSAKHDFSLVVATKYLRLGDLLVLMGVKKPVDTFSGQEYLGEGEEADEAGDPDDRREDSDEDANNAEEVDEDEEEPEPPQPVHNVAPKPGIKNTQSLKDILTKGLK